MELEKMQWKLCDRPAKSQLVVVRQKATYTASYGASTSYEYYVGSYSNGKFFFNSNGNPMLSDVVVIDPSIKEGYWDHDRKKSVRPVSSVASQSYTYRLEIEYSFVELPNDKEEA